MLQWSAAQLFGPHLHSCSSSSSSLARSNDSPPAMDVVDLLCRDPGPRFVIWGNGNAVLPAWGETLVSVSHTYRQQILPSRAQRLHLDHPQLCCHPQSTHLPKPNRGDNQSLQGYGSSLHSVQQLSALFSLLPT